MLLFILFQFMSILLGVAKVRKVFDIIKHLKEKFFVVNATFFFITSVAIFLGWC